MSPFTKVKMSPAKGQENGQTTQYERQRIEPFRSHAKALRKTNEPKRSGRDAAVEHAPDQTLAENLSQKGSGGFGLSAARTPEPQSFSGRREETRLEFTEDQIPRLWSNAGAREAGGER